MGFMDSMIEVIFKDLFLVLNIHVNWTGSHIILRSLPRSIYYDESLRLVLLINSMKMIHQKTGFWYIS